MGIVLSATAYEAGTLDLKFSVVHTDANVAEFDVYLSRTTTSQYSKYGFIFGANSQVVANVYDDTNGNLISSTVIVNGYTLPTVTTTYLFDVCGNGLVIYEGDTNTILATFGDPSLSQMAAVGASVIGNITWTTISITKSLQAACGSAASSSTKPEQDVNWALTGSLIGVGAALLLVSIIVWSVAMAKAHAMKKKMANNK